MSAAIVVAIISGVVSLVAAAISYANSQRLARLEEQRQLRTKQEQADAVRQRYRDPLLSAVFDLQSRLYNIVTTRFLSRYKNTPSEAARTYAIESTLYVLAEYLGWVEIMRREIQFLDLGDEAANRDWVGALENVRDTLARDDIESALRIFRAEQRAIGELMTVAVADSPDRRHHECLGYASFAQRMEDPQFGRWFETLRADLDVLGHRLDEHLERIVLLQNALVDVLDVLDKQCIRYPLERRGRLARPEGLSARPSPHSAVPDRAA